MTKITNPILHQVLRAEYPRRWRNFILPAICAVLAVILVVLVLLPYVVGR